MRRYRTHWRRPLLLAIALATALFFGPSMIASAVPARQPPYPMIGQPLDQLSGDAFDQAFLAQMAMHHAMGVMMTQPVITRGVHQDLKDLGTHMIAGQSGEIDQMRGWLQGWYGQDPSCPMASSSPMTPGAMPGTMPGPSGLQPGVGPRRPGSMMPGTGVPMMPGSTSGMMPGGPMGTRPLTDMPMMGGFWNLPPDQIDAEFMTWMIAHHQGAIDMAALAKERAAHQEVKDLAAGITTSQTAEIETMQGWLLEWYGR
jgi:uncharacterized protein (DUF305 family)